MLRVAEQYSGSDTGRQRRANEDSLMVRSPLFVVADGMGGAQAGEVASKLAVEAFQGGLPDGGEPELALAGLAQAANARIHELSHTNAEQAGMGTTLTAVYVGEREVAIAHVGDSRAYCLRDGQLLRLTDDHSLVDELMRQGRLTPGGSGRAPSAFGHHARARDRGHRRGRHPVLQRPGGRRLPDLQRRPHDDGPEERIAEILNASPRLRDAGEGLIAEANQAGGRDNITVVLLRLEEVGDGAGAAPGGVGEQDEPTLTGMPAVTPGAGRGDAGRAGRRPRSHSAVPATRAPPGTGGGGSAVRRAGFAAALLVVLGLIVAGGLLAMQSVYFIGTNRRGLVTLYQGVPFTLPGGVDLYSSRYVSGVSAATLTAQQRSTLLDHSLRSEGEGGVADPQPRTRPARMSARASTT